MGNSQFSQDEIIDSQLCHGIANNCRTRHFKYNQVQPWEIKTADWLQSASFLSAEQNAVVSFKELCGLSSVANLMQCMVAVSPRFLGPDNTPLVVLNLNEQYPTMELQGIVPEVLKKIVTTYDTVSSFVLLRERGVLR